MEQEFSPLIAKDMLTNLKLGHNEFLYNWYVNFNTTEQSDFYLHNLEYIPFPGPPAEKDPPPPISIYKIDGTTFLVD